LLICSSALWSSLLLLFLACALKSTALGLRDASFADTVVPFRVPKNAQLLARFLPPQRQSFALNYRVSSWLSISRTPSSLTHPFFVRRLLGRMISL